MSQGCCGSEVELKLARGTSTELESNEDAEAGAILKDIVRERYARAANAGDGCGCGCSDDKYDPTFTYVSERYARLEGYEPDADLGLGCGVPTDLARIQEGDVVLDLGSGAGIDAFIARRQTGSSGAVIGVDFTPDMIARARENAARLGLENVRFVEGDIEDLPIESESVDVILSNCVLNLVPRKQIAFGEMHRVLRPGGHFAVSDIVINGRLPDRLRESAALYAGCVSGAIERKDYLHLLRIAGFVDVEVSRERPIEIADDILYAMADADEVAAFKASGGIASITVTGTRPE